MQGRLVEPVYKPAGQDHYRPDLLGQRLRHHRRRAQRAWTPPTRRVLHQRPDRNETAFTYQLFVRAFGTNNLPDCSNMCHESTGWR